MSDPPDDNQTPKPHFWMCYKSSMRGALVRPAGRPRTSTHRRAAYWRAWKQAKKGAA